MYPQPGDEPQVQQDVGRRPHQRGPKGRRALFGHHIDAAHKVGEGRGGHGQGQHGDIPPRGVIGLVRQNADEQRRQGDDPARPQKDGGGEQVPYPPIEPQVGPPVPAALGNGGQLPGVHEYRGQNGQDGGDLIGHGVDAVGVSAQKPLDHIPVRHPHDPPEDGRGDQRDAIAQHLPPQPAFGCELHIPPQPRFPDKPQRCGQVRHRGGQDIASDAPLEHRQKEHVQADK